MPEIYYEIPTLLMFTLRSSKKGYQIGFFTSNLANHRLYDA